MTADDRKLQAELAMRGARQHGSWKERWPCHVDGAVSILSLYIQLRIFFRTGNVNSSSSSTRYQVPGFFPGYMRMRSSPSPKPVSRALELRTRARALLTRFGDGRYAVSHKNFLAHPSTHPCRSVAHAVLTGTYSSAAEAYQVRTYFM